MIKTDPIPMFERHIGKIKQLSNGQYLGLCPFHSDGKPSFSFDYQGLYNCKACGVKGNAITFAKAIGEDWLPYVSDDYKSTYKIEPTQKPKPIQKPKKKNIKPKLSPEQLKVKVKEYHKEWFDSKSKNLFQVGECNGHLTFPYYDKKGEKVIGIKHHKPSFWEGDGKLKWYMEWQLPYMDKSKTLVINEGEPDVHTMLDAGYNSISSSGGAGSIPELPEIITEFKDIQILYDNDDEGRRGAKKLAQVIFNKFKIVAKIGEWRKGLPNKYDCTDDKDHSR